MLRTLTTTMIAGLVIGTAGAAFPQSSGTNYCARSRRQFG